MRFEYSIQELSALADRWWVPVARGIAAMLFGILALVAPGVGLLALVILWGVYAFADGMINLMLGVTREAVEGRSWRWLVVEGIVSVAAGLFSFVWPAMTALVLLAVIAAWAVATGIARVLYALRLRRLLTNEWILATSGALAIVVGLLMLVFPGAGALAFTWLIGGYAIVLGALLVGVGWRLHRWDQTHQPPFATGGRTTAS